MGKSEPREPEKIGALIGNVGNLSNRRKGSEIDRIKRSWLEITGENAGSNSKPTKVSRGTLYIVTRDDPWSSEISMCSSHLIKRLKECTGITGIDKVRIKADRKKFETNIESLNGKEIGSNCVDAGRGEEDFKWEGELPHDEKIREALVRFIRSNKKQGT